MKSEYLCVDRIEFVVTQHCSGRCRHCSIGGALNPRGETRITPQDAARAMTELAEIFDLQSVMAFGGEPLLYPQTVCAAMESAAQAGIPARQLITNGFFSQNPEKIRETAEALAKSGLNQLLISVDAFHQETILLEPVRRFAQCAAQSGIEGVKLHPAWVVNEAHENPYNSETRAILARLADLGLPVTRGNDIFPAGNAKKHLGQYYESAAPDFTLPCGSAPYTSPLTDISRLSIAPNGDVMVCAFVIGNIQNESAADIAARYDPHENPAMQALLQGGVSALAAWAQTLGILQDFAGCSFACDACRKIVRRLPSGQSIQNPLHG